MLINTRFSIGEEVYAIYKNGDEINLFKDKISEILVSKEKQIYYLEKHDYEEWQENELVRIYMTSDLVSKIEKLFKEEDNETK